MAARKKVRRTAARRKPRKTRAPAWLWLVTGILIGLGLATAAIIGGYVPPPRPSASESPPKPVDSPPDAGTAIVDGQTDNATSERPRYDFFTVLPEMEVTVPEQEIRKRARTDPPASSSGPYVLQAGSFRSAADADRLKARLALLGLVADVQVVTVNDATWHRVRLGPFDSARKVDELQRRMRENDIDSRVYKVN